LRAGKPIVATRLLTHTQVLDDEVAELTVAEPAAFGQGILTLIRDGQRAQSLANHARRRAEERYSYEHYLEKTRRALDFLARTAEREKAVPRQAPSP
jgi:glycosyltransferase involved in cell wall biosynthesis